MDGVALYWFFLYNWCKKVILSTKAKFKVKYKKKINLTFYAHRIIL